MGVGLRRIPCSCLLGLSKWRDLAEKWPESDAFLTGICSVQNDGQSGKEVHSAATLWHTPHKSSKKKKKNREGKRLERQEHQVSRVYLPQSTRCWGSVPWAHAAAASFSSSTLTTQSPVANTKNTDKLDAQPSSDHLSDIQPWCRPAFSNHLCVHCNHSNAKRFNLGSDLRLTLEANLGLLTRYGRDTLLRRRHDDNVT